MKLVPWSRKNGSVPSPAPAPDAEQAGGNPSAGRARQRYDLPAVSTQVVMFWVLEGPDPDGIVHHELRTEVLAPEPGPGSPIGVKLELAAATEVRIVPDSGDPVTLRWRSTTREVQVAARVIAWGERGGQMVWKVEVLSEPALTQRRRYVRELVALPVTLYDEDDNPLAAGNTVEISEGGVAVNLDGISLQEGSSVQTELILPEVGVARIEGSVLRSPGGRTPTVIQFEDGHQHQDALRQLVFATQLANRQAMKEWE